MTIFDTVNVCISAQFGYDNYRRISVLCPLCATTKSTVLCGMKNAPMRKTVRRNLQNAPQVKLSKIHLFKIPHSVKYTFPPSAMDSDGKVLQLCPREREERKFTFHNKINTITKQKLVIQEGC